MSRSAPSAPIRAALVSDCQHMATSAMGIAADLARIGEQECAGTPCSAKASMRPGGAQPTGCWSERNKPWHEVPRQGRLAVARSAPHRSAAVRLLA